MDRGDGEDDCVASPTETNIEKGKSDGLDVEEELGVTNALGDCVELIDDTDELVCKIDGVSKSEGDIVAGRLALQTRRCLR